MIILIENCSLYSLNRMWRRRKNSLICLFIPGTIWPTWSHNHSWNFLCCWNESLLLCYNSIIVLLNLMLDSMWKIASSTIICVFICRIRSIMLNGIVHHIIIEPPMIHRLWSLSCQKYLCVHSYSLYNNEVIFILLGFIVSSHGLKSTLLSPDGRGMNMHIGLGHA